MITLDRAEFTQRYPGLLGQGVMHGFPLDELFNLIFVVVGILPMNYRGGDLDPQTSDVILDALGYYGDKYLRFDQMTNLQEAEVQLFYDEIVQTAMDLRLLLPSGTTDFQFAQQTPTAIYATAMEVRGGVWV